jgi:hypothetical protein
MKKPTKATQQEIGKLTKEVTTLQAELAAVLKASGVDDYIAVKRGKNQGRFERIKIVNAPDKAIGHYFMTIDITAKKQTVVIPLSIASGKKPAGFSYHIEGTGEGTIARADVTVRGEGVTQVTVGTIVYAKIPTGKTGTFRVQAEIRGKIGKEYRLIIARINYKLAVTDPRYQQYLKELVSETVRFS